MEARTEIRLLQRAVELGLVTWDQVEAAMVSTPCPEDGGEEARWGPRIAALFAIGALDVERAEALERDLLAAEVTRSELPRPRGLEPPPARPGSTAAEPAPDPLASASDSVWAGPDDGLVTGKSWGRYEVVAFLGAGGMGRVYRAYDPELGRFVALKVLRWNDPMQVERFLREARSQARVEHPNVCKVYEAGRVEGRPYIAMQQIQGRSLAEAAADLPEAERVKVIRDVARALHEAHRTGLIHRDVKPGNILLEEREAGARPYVVDFGLAQEQDASGLTRTGSVTGTPAYLSPEQAQGLPLDPRSDIYSLGVVFYELLCGRVPFRGASLVESLIKVVEEEARPLRKQGSGVSRDLETIVHKCLEKDPDRRYASARELAEDLDRYLDGVPIHARPASLAYRVGKWVRRNRAAALVAAAALVLLSVLGAASLRVQLRAGEVAALAQRFGQEVREIDTSMRMVSLLPLHDVTPHKERLKRRMQRIEAEMGRLGRVGEGPGHYALGRGYLVLQEYQRAYEHLEAAWQAGYRDPEVAWGLGRVLGALYRRALLGVETGSSEELRQASREEIEALYWRPALAYLRQGYGTSEDPYVGAMIAFYDRRYPEAVDQARRASEGAPWFYEARQLIAEVYMEQGDAELERGGYERAQELFAAAGEVYADLLETARSDPSLYAAECGRLLQVADAAMDQGDFPEETLERAAGRCDEALAADPDLNQAFTLKALLFWRRGHFLARRGEDPRPDLALSIEMAEEALERNPRDELAFKHRGSAFRALAAWELNHGGDPLPSIEKAVESHLRATEIRPDGALGHNSLGGAYLTRARYEAERGLDPRPSLDLAAAAYGRAVEESPGFAPAHSNLGIVWLWKAEHELDRGLDPTASIEASIRASEQAVRLNPNYPALRNNLGLAHLTRGAFLLRRGGDPQSALGRAVESFRAALALDPDYGYGHYNVADAEAMRAAYLLEVKRDPAPALEQARRALAEAMRVNPQDSDNYLAQGRQELIAGRWAAACDAEPDAAFASAEAAVEQGLSLNERDPALHHLRAEILRRRAEWALAAGRGASALVDRGLAAVGRALELNPRLAEAQLSRGALLLLAARTAEGPEERREMAAGAQRALEGAVRINPLLERECRELLAAAAALSGSRS